MDRFGDFKFRHGVAERTGVASGSLKLQCIRNFLPPFIVDDNYIHLIAEKSLT